MAEVYEAHLALLTDLLSPGPPAAGVLASVAHHIGTLEDAGLANLVSTMMQSPWLFDGDLLDEPSTSTASPALSLDHARGAFHAVSQGMLVRAEHVKKSSGTGWTARRKLRKTLEAFQTRLRPSSRGNDVQSALKALVLCSSALRTFQDGVAKKDPLLYSATTSLKSLETQTVALISEASGLLYSCPVDARPEGNHLLLAWLIAQVGPDIASDSLKALTSGPFLDFGFHILCACFCDGHLFDELDHDVQGTEQGLQWSHGAPSRSALNDAKQSVASALLGRFSRSLGRCIETISTHDGIAQLQPQLESLESVSERVHRTWARCKWSNVTGPEELHPDTRDRDEPWTILKTLLFTLTMAFSSVISLINGLPIASHRSPPPIVLDLASSALRTFSSVYFVAEQFGTNGFGAYHNVCYGAIDLVSRAEPKKLEQILKTLEPLFAADERRTRLLPGKVPRSKVTFWLNICEQAMGHIPDAYIAEVIVPISRPYLSDKTDQEAFEAAHSAVLAIFSHHKGTSLEIWGWYSDLLLGSYPDLLSISQLRLAFARVVSCLNELDQIPAQECLHKIEDALEATTPGSGLRASSEASLADISAKDVSATTASPAAGLSTPALEAAALQSGRGPLLLVLIDQLGSIDLDLMKELLPRILVLLREEEAAPPTARLALIQVLYNTLASGMDMIKRETAAQWWLEHRAELESVQSTEGVQSSRYPQAKM